MTTPAKIRQRTSGNPSLNLNIVPTQIARKTSLPPTQFNCRNPQIATKKSSSFATPSMKRGTSFTFPPKPKKVRVNKKNTIDFVVPDDHFEYFHTEHDLYDPKGYTYGSKWVKNKHPNLQ